MGAILYITFLESALPLPAFVNGVGYRDIPKGIRAFQSWVNTGTGNMLFLERLQGSPFALDPEVLFDALHLTENQICLEHEQERERIALEQSIAFKPTLHAVAEMDPGAHIVLFAVSHDFEEHTLELPLSIPSWHADKQYGYINTAIRAHFKSTNGESRFLGPIVSYLYRRHWNEPPIAFTTDGQLLGINPDRSFLNTELRIRDKPIQRRLFAHFLCSRDEREFN